MLSRPTVIAAALGLAAGLMGAVIGARMAPRPEPQVPARSTAPAPERVIVPPGWDPRIAEKVAALERRVTAAEGALSRSGEEGSASPSSPDPARGGEGRGAAWEQKRAEHYQEELASQASMLASHQGEPLDAAWSRPVAESIQARLAPEPEDRSFDVKAVDCRSKTCVATLTFASPAEALAFIAHRGPRLGARSCGGYTITPPPPGGEGRYDLPIIYTCR